MRKNNKYCETCAYYDTDNDDQPCCGCVDGINYTEQENKERERLQMNESIWYENLIRENARLQIAREYVQKTKYPEREVLLVILGTEEKTDENI